MGKRIRASDVIFIGLAFFATYFGAGNLIFPPMMGLQSGTHWLAGMVGMTLSAIALPILTLVLIGRVGSFKDITDHVSPKLYDAYLTLVIILTMVISIPRTAAVAIEMGAQGIYAGTPYVPGVIVYFLIVFFVAASKDNVLDKVGKFLTPVMVLILLILVVRSIIFPLGTPVETGTEQPFFNSFLSGYQTGDVSVSIVMATIFIGTVVGKGYSEPKVRSKVMSLAGLVAAVCLFVIYGGLLYMGACGGSEYPADIGQAELLVGLIRSNGGQLAMSALGLAAILACLTTAAGQVAASAEHFSAMSKNKISYRVCEIGVILFCGAIALLGVDRIVSLTAPLFGLLYPSMIVLVILGAFRRFIPNDGAYRGAFFCVLLFNAIETVIAYGLKAQFLQTIVDVMPLSSLGLGWVLPFVVGLIVGGLLGCVKKSAKAA